MMPRGQELLQPVNPVFIALSLLVALALNVLPLGRIPWVPDMVLLLLAFWGDISLCAWAWAQRLFWGCAWMCTSPRCWVNMPWPIPV